LLAGCSVRQNETGESCPLPVNGIRIDSLDKGIENKWYNDLFIETIKLPGSMAENGKGDDVTLKQTGPEK